MRLQQTWRNLDVFRRVPKDLTEPTVIGAIVSIACVTVMLLLFLGEVISFVSPRIQSDMVVARNTDKGNRIKVFIDMDFHKLPCGLLSLDIVDVLHNHELNAMVNMNKIPLDPNGKVLPGSRGRGIVPDVKEGCRITGFILITKVPGNFHVSCHGIPFTQYFPKGINVQHTIRYISFEQQAATSRTVDPNIHEPLLDISQKDDQIHIYKYFLGIVPTVHEGNFFNRDTYQYTAGFNKLPASERDLAVVTFEYSLSPISVRYSLARVSVTHFLTYICAIIGGVYTVAGLLSRIMYSSTVMIKKRLLGKGD